MQLGKEQATGYAADDATSAADAEVVVGMTAAAPGGPGPAPVPETELERAPAG
jgi:hypothetical protein